eukprot:scaffold62741_cov20-Tisochrysis_lutea.AAC.3
MQAIGVAGIFPSVDLMFLGGKGNPDQTSTLLLPLAPTATHAYAAAHTGGPHTRTAASRAGAPAQSRLCHRYAHEQAPAQSRLCHGYAHVCPIGTHLHSHVLANAMLTCTLGTEAPAQSRLCHWHAHVCSIYITDMCTAIPGRCHAYMTHQTDFTVQTPKQSNPDHCHAFVNLRANCHIYVTLRTCTVVCWPPHPKVPPKMSPHPGMPPILIVLSHAQAAAAAAFLVPASLIHAYFVTFLVIELATDLS